MSKKKEDNRDVFEKALDYVPAVIGSGAGFLIGRKLARSAAKRGNNNFSENPSADWRMARGNNRAAGSYRDEARAHQRSSPEVSESYRQGARHFQQRGKVLRDKVLMNNVAGIAGGGIGGLSADAVSKNTSKKRRK